MFCGACGTKMNDGEAFCPNCGAKNETANAVQNMNYDITPGKNKKPLIIIGAALVAIIAVVAIVVTNANKNSYLKPLDEQVKLANKRISDSEKVLEYVRPKAQMDFLLEYNKIIKSEMSDSDYEDYYAEASDFGRMTANIEEELEAIEDHFGDDWKITYEIKDVDELKRSELRDMEKQLERAYEQIEDWGSDDSIEKTLEYLEENYDADIDGLEDKMEKLFDKYSKEFDKLEVTEGYKLEVKFRIVGEDAKEVETDIIYVYKVNGKWITDTQLIC